MQLTTQPQPGGFSRLEMGPATSAQPILPRRTGCPTKLKPGGPPPPGHLRYLRPRHDWRVPVNMHAVNLLIHLVSPCTRYCSLLARRDYPSGATWRRTDRVHVNRTWRTLHLESSVHGGYKGPLPTPLSALFPAFHPSSSRIDTIYRPFTQHEVATLLLALHAAHGLRS